MKTLKPALLVSIVLLVVCGLVYPLVLTGVSQVAFKDKANGSMIEVNGVKVGSELIGQSFTDARFFKGRVSSVNYNTYTKEDLVPDKDGNASYGGVSSGSFNYGATNPELHDRVQKDIEKFLKDNPTVKREDIPTDLLTASGSGLDPNISPASAKIQIPAIAKASGISESKLRKIVDDNTSKKLFGVLGEDRVNVLKVNVEVAKILGLI
ncbi:TPA: K(+)-transporting ATPase subunit C [Clostridioides difficile]|uniref:K(+)-transporting ATPase subunit C n=1 Tax=Clostridioides difficile TaxID=1496 RepID=UPI0002EC2E4B|nr:K(+)-transporting ATPase subunit C [Clostridioides difficile]EGT2231618.1 K(+)-transporting ATPase subunit C [Clostridioides difficile]EGT3801017.1 K(+)-transporting ATPase subunit C [Clostridioides difficile]EGT4003437.1 K(+)-transporting ATPase subunit C [Clostridioides difficile]EGT4165552.1 K(+)-transporting ATPase subunit C [Clostridioides difficile]EGT4251790.1 K(+)-transporting ATPase subunit C [Clostridioides difficile]